ncbi:Crp/Fnr family transcriptional regulator [Aquimarina longa]|uniref:Crp/Fnr family transcriptional regulator n=1 Tax=Aquimarina longa TaxID=1080221 RepID=UPI000783D29C|nr:Crp/Fnr family transcriptional regulator [Aquimarina longa]
MIRTNPELLSYTETIYHSNKHHINIEQYNPTEKIIEQNKRYNWVYIIKEGVTKCYLSDEKGKDFIQEFLGKGMEFGEIEVFSNKPSFCCIEAITELIVYKISYTHFNNLLENDKKFNKLIMKAMAEKISYKAPRHSYQQYHPIEENILKIKENFPEFTEVVSKNDLAKYLGITLRSLNRALSNLKI